MEPTPHNSLSWVQSTRWRLHTLAASASPARKSSAGGGDGVRSRSVPLPAALRAGLWRRPDPSLPAKLELTPPGGGGGARSAWGCLTGHGEKYTPQKKYLREPKTTPSKYQSFKISKFALECLFRVHGAFSPCAARGRIGEPWSACPGRPPTFQEGSATR